MMPVVAVVLVAPYTHENHPAYENPAKAIGKQFIK
jgi:hypothetical protein